MNHVGITAVSDFCRNVAADDEIARLEKDLAYRKQVLADRAAKLKPALDLQKVTRELSANIR